jgi:PadR family transcriptional regulator, regulatory protein PadR
MAKDQIYKGSLTAVILKLLKDQGRMYGYEITRKVEELTSGDLVITEGALYPLLHKLEADGLVEAELVTTGKRPRKYYILTEKGQRETVNRIREINDYLVTMHLLFNPVVPHVK